MIIFLHNSHTLWFLSIKQNATIPILTMNFKTFQEIHDYIFQSCIIPEDVPCWTYARNLEISRRPKSNPLFGKRGIHFAQVDVLCSLYTSGNHIRTAILTIHLDEYTFFGSTDAHRRLRDFCFTGLWSRQYNINQQRTAPLLVENKFDIVT